MNVLIVDDNSNNRMILKLLLEDYIEENKDLEISISEAANGLEAVSECEKNSYDIVLMDIMMPDMDGIEATKIIREKDKNIMIIAVSAVDDSDRKKLILDSGAEDYIPKPINSDIFVSRMSNYITLIKAREHEKINLHELNLFSSNIYSRHTRFIISSEDSLAEFWEFFLLNARKKYDKLSDVVRAIFSMSETQLRLSIHGSIYIEESDTEQYFTLTNIDKLPSKIVELILKKNHIESDYKISDSKISFVLSKTAVDEEDDIEAFELQTDTNSEKAAMATSVVVEEELASPLIFEQSQDLVVYDYMDSEDLNELEEYAGSLSSLMLVVGSGEVSEDEIVEIYSYLEKLGSVLSTYSEVYVISQALSALSVDMSTHISEFMQNSEALGPMCKAFSNDMSSWIEMSFHTGAPSADFMNDTIVVNCQTIGGMLKMDEAPPAGDDDFDDIFDF